MSEANSFYHLCAFFAFWMYLNVSRGRLIRRSSVLSFLLRAASTRFFNCSNFALSLSVLALLLSREVPAGRIVEGIDAMKLRARVVRDITR